MHKKILATCLFAIVLSTSISAKELSELKNQRTTSLLLISPEGEFVGRGETHYYKKNDGFFSFRTNKNYINMFFAESTSEGEGFEDDWDICFRSCGDEPLQVGKYLNTRRMGDISHPGLDISGCGRGNSGSTGNFEILEMNFDNDGNIDSFAANATNSERKNQPPLFACIRYNSTIPLTARVSDIYGKRFLPESFICYSLKRSDNGDWTAALPELKTDRDLEFNYSFYSDSEEGVIIKIENGDEPWYFDFNTIQSKGFTKGIVENTLNENDFDYLSPRITVQGKSPFLSFSKGQFEVLSFEKNKQGVIIELAINFKVLNVLGKTIEGAIRYHSDLPVNLVHPSEKVIFDCNL